MTILDIYSIHYTVIITKYKCLYVYTSCLEIIAECYDGSVRLAGGKNTSTGRVEVCNNNTWGTVCDVGWDNQDAVAACMSAGFYWGMD